MERSHGIYEKWMKRVFDFVFSLIAIILLSPILLIVAVLVKVKLGSPVLFIQKRPGLNKSIFRMYKFRTMKDGRDEQGNLLPDEIRLTKFGKKLRNTSLDELPELFNILKGDMSIVGPRPQLVRDMVFMSKEQNLRHTVRQGLTGLAQVNGRNNITWEEKLSYDIKYIKDISLWSDLKIVGKTISKVFAQKDIVTAGMETAEDYGDYLLRIGKISKKEYDCKQKEAKKLLLRSKI